MTNEKKNFEITLNVTLTGLGKSKLEGLQSDWVECVICDKIGITSPGEKVAFKVTAIEAQELCPVCSCALRGYTHDKCQDPILEDEACKLYGENRAAQLVYIACRKGGLSQEDTDRALSMVMKNK